MASEITRTTPTSFYPPNIGSDLEPAQEKHPPNIYADEAKAKENISSMKKKEKEIHQTFDKDMNFLKFAFCAIGHKHKKNGTTKEDRKVIREFFYKIKSLAFFDKVAKMKEFFKEQQCILDRIEDISLSSENLTSVPPEIKLFTNVKKIDLDENPLTQFPDELFSLKDLENLDLSCCNLQSIPSDFFHRFEKLVVVKILGNPLESIPNGWQNHPQLWLMHISYKQEDSMPAVRNWTKIHDLKGVYYLKDD